MWVANLLRIISNHGGIRKSIVFLCRTDSLKLGYFVGKDISGNRYYENPYYFLSSNRWVVYSDRYGYDYDGSQIHRSWFRWIHHMTDYPPHAEQICKDYPWMLPHEENKTGTKECYVPYSTVLPKIKPWKPLKPIKH